MRSALAYALRALLPDDRTTIRTIAWWRAQGVTFNPRNEFAAQTRVPVLLRHKGACPDEVKP